MACDLDCMVLEINTYYYDIMETRFENGEQKHTDLIEEMTTVYPVTVPGEAIVLFEIMATIGVSVMTSAYLMCHWVMEQGTSMPLWMSQRRLDWHHWQRDAHQGHAQTCERHEGCSI